MFVFYHETPTTALKDILHKLLCIRMRCGLRNNRSSTQSYVRGTQARKPKTGPQGGRLEGCYQVSANPVTVRPSGRSGDPENIVASEIEWIVGRAESEGRIWEWCYVYICTVILRLCLSSGDGTTFHMTSTRTYFSRVNRAVELDRVKACGPLRVVSCQSVIDLIRRNKVFSVSRRPLETNTSYVKRGTCGT